MDPETRAYLDETRRDLDRRFADVWQEFAAVRRDIGESAAETRRHFDIVAEGLRADIRTIAEATAANSEAIARLSMDFDRKLDARFDIVGAAFRVVQQDLADLRARLN